MSENLLSELLYEVTDYNPLDETYTKPDARQLIEENNLDIGLHTLNESIIFSNGEMILNDIDSHVSIDESSAMSIGSIFNIPIFKVRECKTDQYILISRLNINKK